MLNLEWTCVLHAMCCVHDSSKASGEFFTVFCQETFQKSGEECFGTLLLKEYKRFGNITVFVLAYFQPRYNSDILRRNRHLLAYIIQTSSAYPE